MVKANTRSASGGDGEFHQALLAILAELREDARRADARLEQLEVWRLQETANMDSVARSLARVADVLREHEERWHENDARMETVAKTLVAAAETVDRIDRRVTRLEGDRGAA